MKTNQIEFIVHVPKYIRRKDLNRFSWQSLIFYSLLRDKSLHLKSNAKYLNFDSKILKKNFGKNYRQHIAFLLQENWIEENSKYKNGAGGFCKSFRISENNYPWKHKPYAIKLQKRIWEKFAGRLVKDKSDLSSYYVNLVQKKHNTLFIPSARSIAAKKLKIKLDRKVSNLSIGENGRLYSTIITCNKNARKHVIFGKYGKLVNVDVTGMIQQLLNKDIKDQKWNKWIEEDFPIKLIKHFDLPKNSRERVKEYFMVAISKNCGFGISSDIRKLLELEFPKIMEHVNELNRNSSVQLETQKEESRIIREFILNNECFDLIPAHDGVFCGEKIAMEVQDHLECFLKNKGMAGYTKIKPENPLLRRRTTVDILENLFPL
jgi:hypothetical protein